MIFSRYTALSMLLLSGTLSGASNTFYQEGTLLGRYFHGEYFESIKDLLPHTKNAFKILLNNKPASAEAAQAFADLKEFSRGVTSVKGKKKKAPKILEVAQLLCEASTLGDAFIKIGGWVQQQKVPVPADVPAVLTPRIEIDEQSSRYARGEQIAGVLTDLVIKFVQTEDYKVLFEGVLDLLFDRKTLPKGIDGSRAYYAWTFTLLKGLKKGLERYPLNEKSADLGPVKQVIVRLMFNQMIQFAVLADELRMGNELNAKQMGAMFIACGKELEHLG